MLAWFERTTDAFDVQREELLFLDPYREDCAPIPQKINPGKQPRYLAEIWWQIGNYHFDAIEGTGGPYALNRAMSAYEHSMCTKKSPGKRLCALLEAGFYQLFFMDHTEDFAVVHETVESAKSLGGKSAARLVNALLRRGQRERRW